MYTGHSIALINVYPIRYIPGTGTVEYASNWSLKVETAYDAEIADHQSRMLQNSDTILTELDTMVDNGYEKNSYIGKEAKKSYRDNLIDPLDPHDYIIITSEDFLPTFTDSRIGK